MVYWQYSQLKKLDGRTAVQLKVRTPNCLECGAQLMRLAIRETFDPWAWIPTGWLCAKCGAVFVEE